MRLSALRFRMGRPAVLGLAAACGALVLSTASPAPAAGPTGTVTLVHGLPGVIADVTVDGKKVLGNFAPERITAPLALPVGVHEFEVRKTGTSPTSPPAVSGKVVIQAGTRVSVAVGLDAAGQPAAHVFNDEPRGWAASDSAVVVRNVASGGPATAELDGTSLGAPIANTGQLFRAATVGSHKITILAADGSTALGSESVPVLPRSATVLYLVGKDAGGGLVLLAQQVPNDPNVVPTSVRTGTSGLADHRQTLPYAAIGLIALAALGTGGLVVRRRRRIYEPARP